MLEGSALPEPRRVLQIYNAAAQASFRHWSAQDKLEWLEAINQLYWAVVMGPVQNQPPRDSEISSPPWLPDERDKFGNNTTQ